MYVIPILVYFDIIIECLKTNKQTVMKSEMFHEGNIIKHAFYDVTKVYF